MDTLINAYHQILVGGNIMARGRKNYTLDEQIDLTEKQIAETKEMLIQLESKKKDLLREKESKDLKDLYNLITESGHSIDDIKELLSSTGN